MQGGRCPRNQGKVRKNEEWLKWFGESQGIEKSKVREKSGNFDNFS